MINPTVDCLLRYLLRYRHPLYSTIFNSIQSNANDFKRYNFAPCVKLYLESLTVSIQ